MASIARRRTSSGGTGSGFGLDIVGPSRRVSVGVVSGGEAFEDPGGAVAPAVAEAVVQAARPALPEFEGVGGEPVAAPVRRPGDLAVGESRREVALPGFEPGPIG